MAEIGVDIEKASLLLQVGEIIAIPTETVYGLAGNALNEESIIKIYSAKNRPSFDPLIAHFGDIDSISRFADINDPLFKSISEKLWPGPVTVLLPKKDSIPDVLTSGLPTVAVRIPNHKLTLQLLKSLEFPLAAPSANPFGYVSPTTPQHVNNQLGDNVKYILDGGPTQVGVESTIISLGRNKIIVHRLGGLKIEDLEKIAEVEMNLNESSNPVAPGMLKSHYAPLKKIVIGEISKLIRRHPGQKIGVISFSNSFPEVNKNIILSKNQNLDEAAVNLFAALREMDEANIDIIFAEKLPEEGLGRAINDRLKRASAT